MEVGSWKNMLKLAKLIIDGSLIMWPSYPSSINKVHGHGSKHTTSMKEKPTNG